MKLFLVLVLWLAGVCEGTWYEENVYKDSKRVVEDDEGAASLSTPQRSGLLSLLLSLDKLYQGAAAAAAAEESMPKAADQEAFGHAQSADQARGQFLYGDDDDDADGGEDGGVDHHADASVLNSVLGDIKAKPSKRGRYDLSGVLPPLGELCRVMHVRGCSHSRHR